MSAPRRCNRLASSWHRRLRQADIRKVILPILMGSEGGDENERVRAVSQFLDERGGVHWQCACATAIYRGRSR